MATYTTEPPGEGEAVVTRERECLSRGRCHGTDGDHDEEQKDHHRHASRAAHSAGGGLEDVYERKARR
jgi:hypothetical protein